MSGFADLVSAAFRNDVTSKDLACKQLINAVMNLTLGETK